jgi:hypothetical protein
VLFEYEGGILIFSDNQQVMFAGFSIWQPSQIERKVPNIS